MGMNGMPPEMLQMATMMGMQMMMGMGKGKGKPDPNKAVPWHPEDVLDEGSGWVDFATNKNKKTKLEKACEAEEPLITESKTGSSLPVIVGLSVDPASSLVQKGYPSDVAAIAFDKNAPLFGDAAHILQFFFAPAVKDVVEFEHDPECTTYPEVFNAWKSAGQEDACPMIAMCPGLGQWAVGFGGKKNAERAAKLALSLTVAALAEPAKLVEVVSHYPNFGQLCQAAGIIVPNML